MNVLLDTCIIMDFLQNREPFAQNAKKIMQAAAMELFAGFITAKSATDIYYLTHRCTHSDKEARTKLSQLLSVIDILDSMAADVYDALPSEMSDFEDAVMTATAKHSKMYCIVTRNTTDYSKSEVPVYTPEKFIEILEQSE